MSGWILRMMLWNVVSRAQLLGGSPSAVYTASSSQTMPAFGFWCSCGKPSVWPISWMATSMP